MKGFYKVTRGRDNTELYRDHKAYALLSMIADRANWSDTPNLAGLGFGQAWIGDHEKCGLSRKEYRCALERLDKAGLIRFVTSPNGTVATLLDARVFSIRDERNIQKKGHLKGRDKGHLFSVENGDGGATSGATARASKGPAEGQQGAINEDIEALKDVEDSSAASAAKAGEASPAPSSRPRNPLLDALAVLDGSKLDQVTRGAWGAAAKALEDIADVFPSLTVEEIARRAANYRAHFTGRDTITPSALAKWWARCDNPPASSSGRTLSNSNGPVAAWK